MATAIKNSLTSQTECPTCGINWNEIEDCFYGGLGSPNMIIAHVVCRNCPTCRMRFERELRIMGVKI